MTMSRLKTTVFAIDSSFFIIAQNMGTTSFLGFILEKVES